MPGCMTVTRYSIQPIDRNGETEQNRYFDSGYGKLGEGTIPAPVSGQAHLLEWDVFALDNNGAKCNKVLLRYACRASGGSQACFSYIGTVGCD